ncbi:hypothetical protein FAUST_11761 [Fusarium austroamericanum]|uniref:Uncharacterized protein n=1 Tax=Fusarium austroamericanum TaxID=282268 RepID=A0AAN5YYN1_FUSAU|nr:hypothetical protein FAUST_11761 [Fusarium austroamericanum]
MQRATIHTNEVTDTITISGTGTVTTYIDTTVTAGATATVYTGGTSTVTTVVATTVTKAAPSVVVIPETEVHCGVLGYSGSPPVLVTVGSFSFDQCKDLCTDGPFFGLNPVKCRCYSEPMKYSVIMETNSDIVFYDMLCPSASEPIAARSLAKRAVSLVRVPDYLPSKSPSDVSSACSCLIKKPSAPAIITTTGKVTKTVTITQVREATALVSKQLSSFVINKKTSTSVRFATTTKTDSKTLMQTDRQSATVTTLKSFVVTDFNQLVYVTKMVTIEDTRFNTVSSTTYISTVTKTDYKTAVVTDAKPTTITKDVSITRETSVSTKTVLTGGSTITSGTTTIYGRM